MQLDTTTNKGTKVWTLRTRIMIAVDDTKIIPNTIPAGLIMILDLYDARRGNFVIWEIAHLESNATAEGISGDKVMDNRAVISGYFNAGVVVAI